MGFFGRRKIKGSASHTGVGSKSASGFSPKSLTSGNLREEPKAADEQASIQQLLKPTETQTIEIQELKNELSLQRSASDSTLRPVDISRRDAKYQSKEHQQRTLEVNLIKDDLQEQDTRHRERVNIEQQKIRSLQRLFEMQFSRQQKQHEAALQKLEDEFWFERSDFKEMRVSLRSRLAQELRNSAAQSQAATLELARQKALTNRLIQEQKEYSSQVKESLENQLAEEQREYDKQLQAQCKEYTQMKESLEVQLAQQQQRFEAQLRTEIETARARAQQVADRQREELDKHKATILELKDQEYRNEEMIHELDGRTKRQADTIEQTTLSLNITHNELCEEKRKAQAQFETLEQATLTLNRTRNELSEERRKARQAIKDSAIKSQMLEFVQQQCAILQEQLRHEEADTQQWQTGREETGREETGREKDLEEPGDHKQK